MPLVDVYGDKDIVYDCTTEIYGRKNGIFAGPN